MLVDGVRGHLSRQIVSEPPWLTARYMSKNRPDAGTFDIPIQRAFFGQPNSPTPRAGAGCPRSLARLAAALQQATLVGRRDHWGGMTPASHTRSRHERPDRRAGACRSLQTKDTGRAASMPWT